MSERGVFAVDRGIFEHPLFASRDPFSKREAWLWLLSAATWRAKTVFVDGKRVALERGQLAHSIRFMADAWGWPKTNVSRFLAALERENMCSKTGTHAGTANGTGLTLLTICNYEKYQKVSLPRGTGDEPPCGTKVGQQRDKEEIREIRKDSEANASASGVLDLEPVDEPPQAKLFRIGKTLLVSFGIPERRTGALLGQWLKQVSNDHLGLLAAIQYARDHNVAEPVAYVSAIVNGKKFNGKSNSNFQDRIATLAGKARDIERQGGHSRSAETVRSD